MIHRHPVRVYYEDTDLAGIVYYANYLKFIERGRSEWVRDIGVDQGALKEETGIVFAVRRVEADYLSPAHFGDDLVVETEPVELGRVRIEMAQRIFRGKDLLFEAQVTLVPIGADGRPARLPAEIRRLMAPTVH